MPEAHRSVTSAESPRDAVVELSVILATSDRPKMLSATLESLSRVCLQGLRYEVIVVDNGNDGQTPSVVRSFRERLPVIFLTQSDRGKNRALLKGVSRASGNLLVFTDDDVVVSEDWLAKVHEGAARYPGASFFGGRILPRFPDGAFEWVEKLDFDHWLIRSAYVLADWGLRDGHPLAPDQVWGPNMIVRRRVIEAGISFDPTLGPGTEYPLGDETDFLTRAQEAGYHGVYLPEVIVHHCIRPDQLSEEWLARRAFLMGRTRVLRRPVGNGNMLRGVPRYLLREYVQRRLLSWTARPGVRLMRRLEFQITRGEIAQHRTMWKNRL